MGSFDIQCDVNGSVRHVFAALSDVTRMPEWYSAVTVVTELTAPPISRGSRFRIHRNLPGGPVINIVDVTELEPDRVFTLTSVEGPTPFSYRYTLTPSDAGTTIALHGQISTEGLTGPARFAGSLAPRLFARGMEENLNRFRTMIERASA
ncbi:SRPBCC family protein [Agromyces salentinus]|uniref:SRPBCC family protein n=1 Tax=Agromyces salentinus TaxID=269421 RepID=A0ABN2MEE4_9MICO|nr:SRPBCC family protein [Agromyces salentinus]